MKIECRDAELTEYLHEFGLQKPKEMEVRLSPKFPKVGFIENKFVDFNRVDQILDLSRENNRFSNFGPVSNLLEKALHKILQLDESKSVFFCVNATIALHLCCMFQSLKLKKHEFSSANWCTSAFNFYSANVGPLSDVKVIDCDAYGQFPQQAVADEVYALGHGVLITNVFSAGLSNIKNIVKLAQHQKLGIVIDNATGLFDLYSTGPASTSQGILEVVSFHQTKVWGVGEGGIIIGDVDDISELKKLANFGVGSELPRLAATNAKASDFSAAFILDRLERYRSWYSAYHISEKKILEALSELQQVLYFNFALDGERKSPISHVSCVFNSPMEVIFGKSQINKYYKPLLNSDQAPLANFIFDRILSISNNPDCVDVSLQQFFDTIGGQLHD